MATLESDCLRRMIGWRNLEQLNTECSNALMLSVRSISCYTLGGDPELQAQGIG